MAVTQYIGARYVPLYIGEWDASIEYEPLSVVTYQGASYTSKQAVPVGIAISNEQFWVLSGNYNAQVEAYRQEVRRFDERITTNADAIGAVIVDQEGMATNIDRLTQGLKDGTSCRDLLYEKNVYLDCVNGNDETAVVDSINSPFKTLDAAFNALDAIGDNFRFNFLKSGEYTLTGRVYTGAEIHFFTYNVDSTQPLYQCDGDVNIFFKNNNPIGGGGVFFYDSHINFAGNAQSKIYVDTDATYYEFEGNTVYANNTVFDFNVSKRGYIYSIGCGLNFQNVEVYGRIFSIFADGRFYGDNGVTLHNENDNQPALLWVCGTCRTQGGGIAIDSNPNATNDGAEHPAILLQSAQLNGSAETLYWTRNRTSLGYTRFLSVSQGFIWAGSTTINTWNEYTPNAICQIPNITTALNVQV